MRFFKNDNFKLGLIFGLFILSILVVIPAIPVKYSNSYINVNESIGGYYLELFDGKYTLDLRDFKRGLDLQGGIRVILSADMSDVSALEIPQALESSREIIERRVNFLGVSEPTIYTTSTGDDHRITVEIPGVADVDTAVSLIGQTAQIRFRQLKPDVEWSADQFQNYYLNPEVWEDTGLTGSELNGADVVFSQAGSAGNITQAPQIQIRFSSDGKDMFEQIAKNNINKPIGIFLDDEPFPLSMPVVSPELAEGLFSDPVITGNFDLETAQNLSLQIRAGALPVPVSILQQENVGATLGRASIDSSIKAGLLGLGIILLYMFVMYGRLGLIADFALILYSFIVLSLFKIIPVVITLPGIAGFLLSIGMAVDANILIFERIREELNWGKPKKLAIKLGFERAWSSIRDSNLSSLLASFILFYFGSGPVRGFALTLSIGILVSMFSAVFVTKLLVSYSSYSTEQTEKFRRIRRLLRRRKEK